MRKFLPVILILATFLGGPLSARARDIQFPEKTLPAFNFVLPDDWTHEPDTSGNLLMFNPNRMTGFVIIVTESTEQLDDIATEAFGVAKAEAPQSKKPAEISGCKGFTYFSSITNPKGIKLNLETTIVRVSDKYIAAASLLVVTATAREDETAARLVHNGLKLVTE